MSNNVIAVALAAALAISLAPGTTVAETAAPNQPTPQQQKMKDCGAKWQEEKTKTGVKGGTAYRKFMSECLEGGSRR